jgi:NLR family CARD domain-containing protein 3
MFLNISSMQINLVGFKHITDGLKFNKTLISLDVSSNYFGQGMTKYLLNSLPLTNIETLNISKSNLGDTGISSMSSLFSSVNLNKVKKLILSSNKFTCLGLSKFLEGLGSNKILEDLHLDRNNLMGKLISCVSSFLIENKHLKKLNMSKCELDEDAGEAFKVGFIRNKVLQELNISENNLYDEGFCSLCDALATNHTLHTLDLEDNRIREKGGIAFGNMLKRNLGLKTVNLRGNTINDNAATIIVDGLISNNVIKLLLLKMNPISFKYKNEISTIISSHANKKFKNLQPSIKG